MDVVFYLKLKTTHKGTWYSLLRFKIDHSEGRIGLKRGTIRKRTFIHLFNKFLSTSCVLGKRDAEVKVTD